MAAHQENTTEGEHISSNCCKLWNNGSEVICSCVLVFFFNIWAQVRNYKDPVIIEYKWFQKERLSETTRNKWKVILRVIKWELRGILRLEANHVTCSPTHLSTPRVSSIFLPPLMNFMFSPCIRSPVLSVHLLSPPLLPLFPPPHLPTHLCSLFLLEPSQSRLLFHTRLCWNA